MNGAERLSLANRVAYFLVQDQAHRGIDDVFFLLAAAAQHQAGNADLLALDAGNESAGRAQKTCPMPRLRQAPGIINDAWIAALLQ